MDPKALGTRGDHEDGSGDRGALHVQQELNEERRRIRKCQILMRTTMKISNCEDAEGDGRNSSGGTEGQQDGAIKKSSHRVGGSESLSRAVTDLIAAGHQFRAIFGSLL